MEGSSSFATGGISGNQGPVAVGTNITQIINEIGQRVECLFTAPALPPYPIVGRDDLLADLRTCVLTRDTVALSLHGKGGVGKTALATLLAWDDAVLEHFSGGVLWAALGPDGHPDIALATLITALYGPDIPLAAADTTQRVALVKAGLAMRRFLIVFDDVWLPDHAIILRQLASPGCVLLLTTRDQSTAAEFAPAAISLAELDEQHSVDLLTALSPETVEYRDALANIAQAVGGLPLALTLVGGYLRDKVVFKRQVEPTLAAIAQVENWLGLTDHSLHLSFEQIMARSLDALPDDTSAFFLRLAAFAPKPQSFSLDAALAVSRAENAKTDTDIVATLVRRNLLEQTANERLTIHPAIANIAARHCPDLHIAHRAHAIYYLALMDNDRNDWQAIETEWEQINHAWQWLSATPCFEELKQQGKLGFRFNLSLVPCAEELVIPYLNAATTFQRIRGYWHVLILWLEQGLKVVHWRDNPNDKAALLLALAWAYDALANRQQALDYLQQTLAISKEFGDQAGEADSLNGLGVVNLKIGNKQQALENFQQALLIQRQVSDRIGEATTLNNIGGVYHELGDMHRAFDYLQQSLTIRREIGDREGEGESLNNIGSVYAELKDTQQALEYLQQALLIRKQIGDLIGEANCLDNIGGVYDVLGNQQQALNYYQQALAILKLTDDRSKEALIQYHIALIYRDMGNYAAAIGDLELAVAIDVTIQSPNLDKDRAELENIRHLLAHKKNEAPGSKTLVELCAAIRLPVSRSGATPSRQPGDIWQVGEVRC